MTRSEFWTQLELNPFMIIHETRDYIVAVTPRAWREQARSETDRNLQEFCIINRLYYTIEGSANQQAAAIMACDNLQGMLDDQREEEKPSASIVRFPSKDDPE